MGGPYITRPEVQAWVGHTLLGLRCKVLDGEEMEKGVYEARAGAERRRRGSYACGGGGARRRRIVWGATCVRMAVACAHARPIVARLWEKTVEVRGATEGERIVSGLFPEEFEEIDRLAMGEDVE